MIATAGPMPSLSTLLQLGRISNLPTVWTNVIAALVIAGDVRLNHLVWIAPAMTAFYVGGMYLNDFFDRFVDARERPGRPIGAGEISAGAVSAIGFGLLAIGAALMLPFGPAAAACAALLAATIVLYDVWHKANPLSPLVMGMCRALVYIGAGVAATGELSNAVLIGASALASHVAGLTYAAKQENLNKIGNLWPLLMLAVPFLLALRAGMAWLVAGAPLLLLAADGVAIWLLARKLAPGAVARAVSGLIAAICLVDAVAVAWAGGSVTLVAVCALGYPLTRLLQRIIPGT